MLKRWLAKRAAKQAQKIQDDRDLEWIDIRFMDMLGTAKGRQSIETELAFAKKRPSVYKRMVKLLRKRYK